MKKKTIPVTVHVPIPDVSANEAYEDQIAALKRELTGLRRERTVLRRKLTHLEGVDGDKKKIGRAYGMLDQMTSDLREMFPAYDPNDW